MGIFMNLTETDQSLYKSLYDSMISDHKAILNKTRTGYSAQTYILRKSLMDAWAEPRGLVQAHGAINRYRLFGKQGPARSYHLGHGMPNDDHVSIWRRKTDHGIKISAWVSQPYFPTRSEDHKRMSDFAKEFGFQYIWSQWPAWHYPCAVAFITWTVKDDDLFANDLANRLSHSQIGYRRPRHDPD